MSVTLWVIVGASLAVAALVAIGLFAFAVYRAVKGLSKELASAGKLVADLSAPIQAGMARAQAGNGSRPGGSVPTDR